MNPSAPRLSSRLLFNRATSLPFLLLGSIGTTLVVFYGIVPLFIKGVYSAGLVSVAAWSWQAWNPSMNQEHSKLVPFISLFLVWYHRRQLREAIKAPANGGLIFVGLGIFLFALSARCLQPRIALAALPFLIYGGVVYLWGWRTGRIILFPCAFLIFLIPFGAVEQATFKLQFVITDLVSFFAKLIGVKVNAIGTTLTAADGSFNFEIAEGCSGIRSLTAMAMLTAVYVHLTQNRLWKKILIVAFSIVFAIAGNVGRIVTVFLVAKLINPQLASGIITTTPATSSFPSPWLPCSLLAGFLTSIPLPHRAQSETDSSRI